MVEKHIEDFDIDQRRGGHYVITIRNGDKSRKLFTGGTPSDNRGLKNLESDVKRLAAEIS